MIKEFKKGRWYGHVGGPKPRYLHPDCLVTYLMRFGNKSTGRAGDLTWRYHELQNHPRKHIVCFYILKEV